MLGVKKAEVKNASIQHTTSKLTRKTTNSNRAPAPKKTLFQTRGSKSIRQSSSQQQSFFIPAGNEFRNQLLKN